MLRTFILFTFMMMVCMVTAEEETKRKKEKPEGCLFNGDLRKPGEVVHVSKSNCLRLKCIKRTNKKGKTKYLLKPKGIKGCRCSRPCPKCGSEWDPACGSNNKTYVNNCQIWGIATPCGRDQAELLYHGECGKCPTGCPDTVKPVCGTDGKTYENECQLLKAGCDSTTLEVAHRVKCEDVPAKLKPRHKCKYNNQKYKLGETIEYLGNYCLEVSCQLAKNKKEAEVKIMDFQGSRSCQCTSKGQDNGERWSFGITEPGN